MSAKGLFPALSWLLSGLGVDSEMFAAAAAAAVLLLVAALAATAWLRDRRLREERAERRRAESAGASREKELAGLRARICGLEAAIDELRQGLAARVEAPAAGAEPAPAPVPAPAPAEAGPAALVCASDARVARVYESMLAVRGFRVRRCADGADAVALAAEDRPAMALIELSCAGPEPLKVLHSVRAALSKGGRVFAVAADEVVARTAAEAGAEVVLQPVDFVELARRLRGAAAGQEARR